MIVLNSLKEEGAGFGKDTNKIVIFDRIGNRKDFDLNSKDKIANDIVNAIIEYAKS
jgi:phosphopantothenoylcysteine decarboxylase/phosphopantothenate--cysteine ligase